MPHRLTKYSDRFLVGQLNLRGFSSRHVSTSQGKVHVLDARGRGSLPPLLVLHGFSAAAHYYDGVMLRMRPFSKRVIAPDLLGHGFSEMPTAGLNHSRVRDALLQTIDTVVDEPVIVFGNSLGGAAAIQLALARPEKVRALFLVAPGGAPMNDAELRAFIDRFRLRTHEEALDFVDRLFAKPHAMRQLLAWGTKKQFERPGLRDLLEGVGPDVLLKAEELASLRVPVHVIWGAADRVLHASHLDFFRRHLPSHAQLQVIDHYGHVPHMDYAAELHHRLLAFSKDVASGRSLRSADRPEFPGIPASIAP